MDNAPQHFRTIFCIQLFLLLGCGEGRQENTSELFISSATLKHSGWKPGNNTYLVSPNGTFCAGFYNVSPNNYAFAVWYANDPQRTVAWMANRDYLVGYNSSLTLKNGNLTISDSDTQGRISSVAWNATIDASKGVGVEMGLVLLDSGNLVFNASNKNHTWQSFDSPTFTLLPTQIFSKNSKLVSRRNDSTYASGVYIFSAFESNTPSLYYNMSELGSDQLDLYGSLNDLGVDGYLDDDGNLISSSNSKILMASDSGDPAGPLRR